MQYNTREDVIVRANEAVGKPFRLYETRAAYSLENKGSVGNYVQEVWFGIPQNSRSEADFADLGIELKVTPYTINDKRTASKERLVLNIINYMTEKTNTLRESSFWKKNRQILLMFYHSDSTSPRTDWSISHVHLWNLDKCDDIAQIEEDWRYIAISISNGRAHELSEGATMILGACTKGSDRTTVRKQPASEILAKQRAYCIKQPYMTALLQRIMQPEASPVARLFETTQHSDQPNTVFETRISKLIHPYIGSPISELFEQFRVRKKSKSAIPLVISRILGYSGGSVNTSTEFRQAGIQTKVIVAGATGSIRESMSFPRMIFREIADTPLWEESEFYQLLSSTRFFFIVFQSDVNQTVRLRGVKFWHMPNDDLDRYAAVWKRARQAIISGDPTAFPKQSQHPIGHVRPHARKATDTDTLPDGSTTTKRSFWLNRSYVETIVNDLLDHQ